MVMEQIQPLPDTDHHAVPRWPSLDVLHEIQDHEATDNVDDEERRERVNDIDKQFSLDLRSDITPSQVEVIAEVDELLETTLSKDSAVEVPKCVEALSEMVFSIIMQAETETKPRFRDKPEKDSSFFDSVGRLSKLTNRFDKVSAVLQQSMSFLEDEFWNILESQVTDATAAPTDQEPDHYRVNNKSLKILKIASFSFYPEPDSAAPARVPDFEAVEDRFPGFSPETISTMQQIANSMIFAGYGNECYFVYNVLRKNAFKSALSSLGFEIISVDIVHKMQWETLQGEIASWTNVVKQCSDNLFPKEQKLCESVFSDHRSVPRNMFGDIVRSVSGSFVVFAEAVVLTKRSPEKLFKMLDMYEAIKYLIAAIDDNNGDEMKLPELLEAKNDLAKAALNMFCEIENSIKNDNGRVPVPSGAVHPLTRYTMNYLIHACDQYRNTLEVEVFRSHGGSDGGSGSPLAMQLTRVMELLTANLDMKSKLYKEPSLGHVFLMNNGRYIQKKIKGSTEMKQLMGDTWYRKRSSELKGYHKSYQRETWNGLLQCLSHEGLQVNGKLSKPVLKERFKSFNAMFEDIHKTQSTWVVSDEQLQTELRVSITAVVTPAYRSFLARFSQNFYPGRQTDKYVKYQPEDIESLIEGLFDGNPSSMGRRR